MGCVVSFFQYGSYDVKEASEQPTEDEGTRRDIPESEYEKQSPEQTEAIPKHESIPEKVSESTVNSNVIQETKSSESEKTKPSSSVEQRDIPEQVSSPTLVQETQPSQIEVTKSDLPEEKREEVFISNIENIQVSVDEEPKLSVSTEKEVESETDNLEGAVVKIQAGIRGYLTRKTLKEQRENISPRKSPVPEESNKEHLNKSESNKEEILIGDTDLVPEKVILQSNIMQETPVESNDDDTENVEKAAVKIQSVYRGYITRKNLSNIGDELTEESNDIIDQTKEKSKEISQSEMESSVNTEEIEDENEEGALEQAAVKIQSTFRGYQVRKQRKNGPKKEETKEQLLIDNNLIQDESQDESEKLEIEDPEAEGKAAVKIQAMYRGYKVRKEIKMIGEDGDETIENKDSKHEITDFDKNTLEYQPDTNLEEYSEEVDDDGILKSKTTIVLSTGKDDKSSKVAANEENILIDFSSNPVETTAQSASLLDRNDEEQCFQKPMVPISNETTIPKSVSEPTVDLNSITKSNEDHLLSPSSD